MSTKDLFNFVLPAAVCVIAFYFHLNSRGVLSTVEFADDRTRKIVSAVSIIMMAISAAYIVFLLTMNAPEMPR